MTRNVQVIDGAENCTYDIFEVSEADFELLFPDKGQDVEFSEDVFERLGDTAAQRLWNRLWKTRVAKSNVVGIHATLFCGLQARKRFYPTKREAEMSVGFD